MNERVSFKGRTAWVLADEGERLYVTFLCPAAWVRRWVKRADVRVCLEKVSVCPKR